MKKKISNIIVLISGLVLGVTLGYFLVSLTGKINLLVVDNIKNLDFFKIEKSLGGPQITESFFSEKEGKYLSNYEKKYRLIERAPVPIINAKSYLVGDINTGEIILAKNEKMALPIASISKLMTAIVADENYGLSEEVKVTDEAINTYGKQGRLLVGEIYKISEILYPLLLESSNDAAEAIAETVGRNTFIQNMNKKAKEIEMFNTNFSDPSGLTTRNISSVSDLFKLSQYIEKYRNYIFEITSMNAYKIDKKTWYNNSKLKSDKNYYGGKNGYTDEARHTQLAIFDTNLKGGDYSRRLVFIILNTDNVEENIYGLKRYVEKYVRYE